MKNLISIFLLLSLSILVNAQSEEDQAKILYFDAEKAYNHENYSECIGKLEQVEAKLGNTNSRVLELKIKAYSHKKDYANAYIYKKVFFKISNSSYAGYDNILRISADINKNAYTPLIKIGLTEYNQSNYKNAIKYFEAANEIKTIDNYDVLNAMLICYEKENKPDKAEIYKQKVNEIKLRKDNSAWNTAKQKNTVGSYSYYIHKYPTGIHIEDAKEKRKDYPTQFIDNRDNKTYKIVYIGNQVWMAENLAYNAGSGCWAHNNTDTVSKYGYVYNWETAKNVCPQGYHLPTKAEYETLLDNCGGRNNNIANYQALIPGGSSGFSAIVSYWYRGIFGDYYRDNDSVNFWSSSTSHINGYTTYAWRLCICSDKERAAIYMPLLKTLLFPVRCVQDN